MTAPAPTSNPTNGEKTTGAAAPETARLAGVCFARSDEGLELPVVDVTHPAFAVAASEEDLSARAARFVEEAKRRERVPAFVQRLMLRLAMRHSRLGQALLGASGTFLSGMPTYLLKLGPQNLGAWADQMDRRIVESFPAFATRLRLQDMARLTADGLAPALASAPASASPSVSVSVSVSSPEPASAPARGSSGRARPLCLINIAGGPAADSWNTLLLLRKERPDSLASRRIVIAVLDLDTHGPAFGARAIAALLAPGAPLAGLDVTFTHVPYDWRDTRALKPTFDGLRLERPLCAISSEGGLFEYGSDEEIVSNLAALRDIAPEDAIVVGSVTRDDGPSRMAHTASRVAVRLRSLDAFRDLARRAGWTVDRAIRGPFSFNLRLRQAA